MRSPYIFKIYSSFVMALIAGIFNCWNDALHNFPSGCARRSVAVIVEPALESSIKPELNQFFADLCTAGYNTLVHTSAFNNPAEVRTYLQNLHSEPGRNLVGAVLIGDIPHAYQWVTLHSANPDIPSSSEEVISFQYFTDLDGTFAKSGTYTSPGSHEYSFDQHTGNVGWELWVGVLPRFKGSLSETTSALKRYFLKNHNFRIRKLTYPNIFLQVNELNTASTTTEYNNILTGMRTGPYAWTPFSNASNSRLYFNSASPTLSVLQGYNDLYNGVADFTVTDAHGSWSSSGLLTGDVVDSHAMRTLFFWSNSCAVGDLDQSGNLLSSILYNLNSDVLIAKGTTNNSGGMGGNTNGFFGHNIATALSNQKEFGDAILYHVNTPLLPVYLTNRELHYGTAVILGDPTLRRSNDWWKQASYSLDCKSRPDGTVCVEYDDGFIWLVKDSIKKWEKQNGVQTAIGLTSRYEHKLGTNIIRRTK